MRIDLYAKRLTTVRENTCYNDKPLQGLNSNVCGDYCLFYLLHRAWNVALNTIQAKFKSFFAVERTHVQYTRPESDRLYLPEPEMCARRMISNTGSKSFTGARGLKMMANRLDQIRWRKFVLARVHQTHLKSVGERQAKQAITHEIYDVLKAMCM